MEETQAPQTEAVAEQTTPDKPAEPTYSKADIDAAVEKAREAWNEKFERLERRRTKAEARADEFERKVAEYAKSDHATTIDQLKADLETTRGKLSNYKTGIIARDVAAELSADAGLISTLITGMRSQGVLDEEPEDAAEAAKAWAEKLREKHGEHFGSKPEADAKQKRRGLIPSGADTRPNAAQAYEKRNEALRKAGGKGIRV